VSHHGSVPATPLQVRGNAITGWYDPSIDLYGPLDRLVASVVVIRPDRAVLAAEPPDLTLKDGIDAQVERSRPTC
jgi:hypothetical protein